MPRTDNNAENMLDNGSRLRLAINEGSSMSTPQIITANSIITMNPTQPRAEAVAFDVDTKLIIGIGTLEECQAAAPGATVTDIGAATLMPGFVEPHSHPFVSGLATQPPAYWIAPYVGFPNYSDVTDLFTKLNSELPAEQAVIFNGLDRILQQAPQLTNADLDVFFPDRIAAVLDNSGHEIYFNSATIKLLNWADGKPPTDPVGGRYGRNADGTSNGLASESAAIFTVADPVLALAIPHPLLSGAQFYKYMASFGITSTSDMTYSTEMLKGYEALASRPDCPMRISFFHMSTEGDAGDKIDSPIDPMMVTKQGIKLWADGSPWVGSIASSFPYLDSPIVQHAQIPLGPGGEAMMNYTRAQLDEILAKYVPMGWQFAFHCNGDVGLDIVLDAYEHALVTNNLLGTDHRWRVEHMGGCRGDQFKRAAQLGVGLSLGPFQFIYWGDVLDGQMFPTEIGSEWMRWGDAVRSGAVYSFHNDGSVSPPNVLLNMQTAITRMTPSGQVHGPGQIISLDDAFKAQTINAAHMLFRDKEVGSIEVGKYADFVELSMDPYRADPTKLASQVTVNGTWLGGHKIDLDAFIAEVTAIDPTQHKESATTKGKCC